MYGRQGGVIYGRGGQTARRRDLRNAERKLGENRRWLSAYRGKNGVRRRNRMDTAKTTVGFRWILHRLQIVSDRDDREQNEDENSEGDYLGPAACAGGSRAS